MNRPEYTPAIRLLALNFNIKLVVQEAAGLRDPLTTELYAEGGGAFLGFLFDQGWTLTPPDKPVEL